MQHEVTVAPGGQWYPHMGPVGEGAWGTLLDRNGLWGEVAARAGVYGAGTGGDGVRRPLQMGLWGQCSATGGAMLWAQLRPWGSCGDPISPAKEKDSMSPACPAARSSTPSLV